MKYIAYIMYILISCSKYDYYRFISLGVFTFVQPVPDLNQNPDQCGNVSSQPPLV